MRDAIIILLIQHFEADFLWKVSLKILNSEIILKTFTHVGLDSNCMDVQADLSLRWALIYVVTGLINNVN